MKRMSKGLWVTLVVIMVTAVFTAGCASNNKSAQNSEGAAPSETATGTAPGTATKGDDKPDISKKVTLKMVNFGNEPKDMPAVLAEMNKIIERDLNATLEIEFLGTADVDNKYNLLLTSGEHIDLMFSAFWLNYGSFAQKGAFQPLDDLLPKYAPNMWKNQTKEGWKDATVNGKIYSMPNEIDEFSPTGIVYREDLRKKYNLPEINSMESIEAYLDGIKKNEPGMMPAIPSQASMNAIVDQDIRMNKYRSVPGANFLYIDITTNKIVDPAKSDALKKSGYERTKRWNELGYIPKDTVTNNDNPQVSVESGKAAAQLDSNPGKTETLINNTRKAHPDWEFGFFPYEYISGWLFSNSRAVTGYSVPKASKNAERAVMLIDKFHSDEELYDLITYGIKGKHYNLTADNKVDLTGIDSAAVGYSPDAASQWGLNSNAFRKKMVGGWAGYDELFKKASEIAIRNEAQGFTLDSSSIKNELAAITQILNTYLPGLRAGSMKDVEATMKEMKDKEKVAGYDKVLAEVTKQWDAYVAANNLAK